ncbi:MAG: hypothetical protein J0H34_00405 [Rhizobiales bacterium]|nr:hypothetical protein [Hyphomicrobiales bacterium]
MASPFVSELVRAANDIQQVSNADAVRLLERASMTIGDYRKLLGHEDAPAIEDGSIGGPDPWKEMADSIDGFQPQQVAELLLNAAAVIRAATIVLEIGADKPRGID